MRSQKGISLFCAGLLILCLIIGCGDDKDSVTGSDDSNKVLIGFFKLDPLATYLHICMDPYDPWYDDGAIEAIPVALSDHGIISGDSLLIEVRGEFFNGNNYRSRVLAVFSSSDTLYVGSQSHRVPGAIEAGEDYVSIETYGCGNEPTDIPEDFYCTPEVDVVVPAGATHLFICARDSYYEDNTDEDDDFGVRISKYKK